MHNYAFNFKVPVHYDYKNLDSIRYVGLVDDSIYAIVQLIKYTHTHSCSCIVILIYTYCASATAVMHEWKKLA